MTYWSKHFYLTFLWNIHFIYWKIGIPTYLRTFFQQKTKINSNPQNRLFNNHLIIADAGIIHILREHFSSSQETISYFSIACYFISYSVLWKMKGVMTLSKHNDCYLAAHLFSFDRQPAEQEYVTFTIQKKNNDFPSYFSGLGLIELDVLLDLDCSFTK